MNIRESSPYVEIIEQPASNSSRFYYKSEYKMHPICGVNSTPENKTFPTIRIIGCKGPAKITVSCVTKDEPYRPHPYNLIAGEKNIRGVHTVEVSSENMTVTFENFSIGCVKKRKIKEALRIREELHIDPFQTGYEHKYDVASIDFTSLRLCFEVFLEGRQKGEFNVPLKPVVSNIIFDKKIVSAPFLYDISHSNASVTGGTKMILLCEKVMKDDIQIRFFEEKDEQVVWEGFGDFEPDDVYKQIAIVFRTPAYSMQEVTQPVKVYIQLKRPSDGAMSKPLPFQLFPSKY